MSRHISAAMQAHLESGNTSLAMCWRLTPAPPQTVIGFTDHHQDIVSAGVRYQAKGGLSVSALNQDDQLRPDNIEADFFLNLNDEQAHDLRAGVFDHAALDLFLMDVGEPTLGKIPLLRGRLSSLQFTRGQAAAQIVSQASRLAQNLCDRTSPTCRARLGDRHCRVKLAPFTVTGYVTKATNNRQVFTDDKRTEATNAFNQGLLTWQSGHNTGITVDLKRFVQGGVFYLFEPLFKPVSVDDRYQVVRGCDKTITTCETVFNNVVNFRGEPHLPGNDHLFKVGGQ